MIKNLIFDFGNVLVYYDYDKFLSSVVSDPGERSAFKKVVCSPAFLDRCDRGDEPFPAMIRALQDRYPQWKTLLDHYRDRQLDLIEKEFPGMRDLLAKLKSQGFGLYGLTNWSATVYPVIDKFDIFRMLDGWVISSEEHLIKPEKGIYLLLCEKFGLKPEECLFADDKEANVEGARSAGMEAILFQDAGQFGKALEEYIRMPGLNAYNQ